METKEQKRAEAIKANELLKTDKKEQKKLARHLNKLGILYNKVLTRAVIHKVITKKDLEDAKMTLDEYLITLMINKKININHDFKFIMDFHMNINGFEFIAVDIQRNGIYEVVWVGGIK